MLYFGAMLERRRSFVGDFAELSRWYTDAILFWDPKPRWHTTLHIYPDRCKPERDKHSAVRPKLELVVVTDLFWGFCYGGRLQNPVVRGRRSFISWRVTGYYPSSMGSLNVLLCRRWYKRALLMCVVNSGEYGKLFKRSCETELFYSLILFFGWSIEVLRGFKLSMIVWNVDFGWICNLDCSNSVSTLLVLASNNVLCLNPSSCVTWK